MWPADIFWEGKELYQSHSLSKQNDLKPPWPISSHPTLFFLKFQKESIIFFSDG